jgi:hypothetical protein
MTGMERFALRSWALVVVGASYLICSWDSWVRRALLLGVEGADGGDGVGMLDVDDCVVWATVRDSGRL